MSKSVTGNIWRLDKGIKRLEKSIGEIDSGIAQLHRNSISELQYNRMRADMDDIAHMNKEIIRKLEDATERRTTIKYMAIVFIVNIIVYSILLF